MGNLATGLSTLVKLRALTVNLGGNSVGRAGATALSDALPKMRPLKVVTFNLERNGLTDGGLESMLASFRLLPLSSITLVLSGNELSDQGVAALANILFNMQSLVSVA